MTEEGIRGFLVENGTPGFAATAIEHKFSLRASVTAGLFFDNVRGPPGERAAGGGGVEGARCPA